MQLSIALRQYQLQFVRRVRHFASYGAAVLIVVTCCPAAGAFAGEGASPRNDMAAIMARAAGGSPEAQARLGWLFSIGRGVPQNYYEAAKWYFRAADQGEGEAQRALGMLYNKGEGVPKDLMLAYMWLDLSAAHGADRDFRARLRDAIASKMTAQQVQTAQRMSLDWYRAR
jgi:TPR repeat protein